MSKKPSTSWLFKMAWRDARSSRSRLSLFIASIVLGIAAVVSIQSFSEDLKLNIEQQSKALMGADFLLDSRYPPNERVLAIMDSLGGSSAEEINFSSMCLFPKNGRAKLVQIKGIQGPFPFYGELETSPPEAARNYQQLKGALVDATVLLQNNIEVGDSIKVGAITLPIIGALNASPGTGGFSSSIAPPVFIPRELVDQTELVQTGSRVEYQYYFVSDDDTDLDVLHKAMAPVLDAEDYDIDTHLDTSRSLGQRYTNFATFLNLVAFIALLLGCVGIASSVHIYLLEKKRSIAVLKCMGASRKQTFFIYLIQILVIGLVGGFIGSAGGVLLQESFPYILGDFLPFDILTTFSWSSFTVGLILGVLMSGLFALPSLVSTWYVSPLQVLRITSQNSKQPRRMQVVIVAAIITCIWLFAYWLLQNLLYATFFILGIAVTFAILSGVSVLFTRLIKKFFPRSWGFTARQSLLNLFRPQNQTATLILTIGVGTFLLSTLYFTKDLLLAKLSLEENQGTPNIILLDIQSDQKEKVAKELDLIIDNIPIVTMRVHSIKGELAQDIRKDTASRVSGWMLNHEFRATYRSEMIASEELVSGDWVATDSYDGSKPVAISVSESVQRDALVEVGDEIVFNVQGVLMKTKVANIRKVDWGRMQLNFSLVFPDGVLNKAPQFHVLSTHTPNNEESADLQNRLIEKFPNISIIDFRQILNLIEEVLSKISWVINFMAIFSIFTGIIVLIGAVRTSKYQRIRENVLLRTLGANGKQILQITAYEYLYLGILGSASGVLLSLLASQLLAYFVFDLTFAPSLVPFAIILPGITALVIAIGLSNSRGVLRSPPLQILRGA